MQCVFKVNYPPPSEHYKHCVYTNPFNQRASAYNEIATLALSGGLKGKIAPGDAHPYLVLFYFPIINHVFIHKHIDKNTKVCYYFQVLANR